MYLSWLHLNLIILSQKRVGDVADDDSAEDNEMNERLESTFWCSGISCISEHEEFWIVRLNYTHFRFVRETNLGDSPSCC